MTGPRLLLLRHAEPASERGRLLGSRADPGLSLRGLSHAAAQGAWLRSRTRVDAVVSSPLRRAVETAELAFPGLPLRIDWRLAEQDLGELTGQPRADATRAWIGVWCVTRTTSPAPASAATRAAARTRSRSHG